MSDYQGGKMSQKITRLRIAVQKKGRLNKESQQLLKSCGLKFHVANNALIARCENLPIDILFVRDDDIPTLVMDDICELGIVGQNVLFEHDIMYQANGNQQQYDVAMKLGFGKCRLSIAFPEETAYTGVECLQNLSIATSYPNILGKYLVDNNIDAEIMTISGSVEIAPRLEMADAICDLVSTGRTLEENKLEEVTVVMKSEAVLLQAKSIDENKRHMIDLLLARIDGVLKAQESKYIMLHAPRNNVEAISALLPGSETPTIMSLDADQSKVAIHAVASEGIFWDTLEKLKAAGASSILVLPIEKMLG
jgi:ATP phosphoribosyltransferase